MACETKKELERMKLKPCPFCGGKAKFAKSGADSWVFCENCGASQDYCKKEKETVDNWNFRAEEKRLGGIIREVKEKNSAMKSVILEMREKKLKKEEFPRLRAVLEKAEVPEGTKAEFRFPNFEPSSYSCRACKSGTDEEIARLRETLKARCNEFNRGNWLYSRPPCGTCGVVDGEGHCKIRKSCSVYAEIVKGEKK